MLALASMPLMSIHCAGGAFQRKIALTKPATPAHGVAGGATITNEQYVLSPHTMASQAFNATGPPALLAKPQGSLPRATLIFAFAVC
jgi:hypothetical protein